MKPRRGDIIAGRFEVEELAGTGGMGEVFRAMDLSSREPVALKLLREQLDQDRDQGLSRFQREARLLGQLRHPGIVRYVAHGLAWSGVPFLAMEWLTGSDLATRLSHGTPSVAEVISIGRQVARALGYAHSQGIVHRDIKPSNLVVCDAPPGAKERLLIKVVDFGIARRTGRATEMLTATGMMLGTPCYMAPEQAKGANDIGPAADVFALGCVLFHCLVGHPPFRGEHALAILAKVVFEEAPQLRTLRADTPVGLDGLVRGMLAKDPSQRPADGLVVDTALRNIGVASDAEANAPSLPVGALTGVERRLVSVIVAEPGPSGGREAGAGTEREAGAGTEREAGAGTEREAGAGTEREAGAGRSGAVEPETPSLLAQADTLACAGAGAALALEQTTRAFGTRLEALADGTLVATICCTGSALDQVAHAARCALAVRKRLPSSRMVLTTGRGIMAGLLPVGEAIDRAVRILHRGPESGQSAAERVEPNEPELRPVPGPGLASGRLSPLSMPVQIDDVTAGLLEIRFDITVDGKTSWLHGERESVEPSRTLLGKPTACVGRNRELSMLTGILDECLSEPVARAVLITGEAGVGKSRLVQEFLSRLRGLHQEPRVLLARGDPMRAGSPFGMLSQALRGELGLQYGQPSAELHDQIRARLGELPLEDRDRIGEFIAEILGVPVQAEPSTALRAARENAQLMGDQMCRAWEELLSAECQHHPVLIVLEDLHWGDLPSVKFVDAALRNRRDAPVMVLALARPEVHETFPEMWSGRDVVEIRLGELTRKACEKLVRDVLGNDVPIATVDRIVGQSRGNAFYLEELIRAVATGAGDRLPETVLAMVQARIEGLCPDSRRVLRAASVFGQVFWEEGLLALLGRGKSLETRELLRGLVDEEIVVRRSEGKFPGTHEYVFCHSLVREAAYAMLTEADRPLGHRLAGHWLEESGETEFVVLAEHYDRGGDYGRAAWHWSRGAEQALEGGDVTTVLDRTSRGLRCAEIASAPTELWGALHLARASAEVCAGDLVQAEQSARAAVSRFRVGEAQWFRAVTQLIVATGRQMHLDAVLDAVHDAVEAPVQSSARPAQMACLCRAVVALLINARFEDADRLLGRVEAIFDLGPPSATRPSVPIADIAMAAELHRARAFRSLYGSDLGAAAAGFSRATAAFEQANDRRSACLMTCNLGVVYKSLGDYDQAETALRRSLASAEKLGMRDVVAAVMHNLGMVIAALGRLPEALVIERKAVALCRRTGDPRLEGGSRCYLSSIECLAGHADAAETEARAASELLQVSPPTRVSALAALTRALLAQGRTREALAVAEEGIAIVDSATQVEEGEAFIRLVHIQALTGEGQAVRARLAAARALCRLLDQSERIHDAAWRRSFLERVPENAAIVVAARGFGVS